MVAEGGQHFTDLEGGTGACGAHGMTDTDGVVLSESGWHPGDVVPFMLTRAWLEVEDGTSCQGSKGPWLEVSNRRLFLAQA